MIGWLPHSTSSVYAGVRFRCIYPMRTLRQMGIQTELVDFARLEQYRVVVAQELLSREDPGKPFPTGRAIVPELERMKQMRIRIVLDVCDNHFYHERDDPTWSRANDVFREMVRLADDVVFSTQELSRQLGPILGGKVRHCVIGDALEVERDLDDASLARKLFGPQRWRARMLAAVEAIRVRRAALRGTANLVWFGSAGTSTATGGMDSLVRIQGILEEFSEAIRPVRLAVISNNRSKFESITRGWGIPTAYVDWDRTTFMPLLRSYELCVIPIERNPFTVVKSNNRVLTALHCGLPVVADGIPSFTDFSACIALDDWMGGLSRYLTDKQRSEADVAAGRAAVEQNWSHQVIGASWAALLDV